MNIDGLISDVQVNLAQGEILLHLPEEQKYSINAKSSFGNVNSDFRDRRSAPGGCWGIEASMKNPAGAHKLNLKVGFGDIVILKIRVPKPPEPTTPALKAEGL